LVYLQQFKRKFTVVCVAASNSEKFTKTPIFGVQGYSRSSMLVPPESSSAVLVMICSKSVSICNHSRARLADSSRNRTFWRGYLNLMHSFEGNLFTQRHQIISLETRDHRLQYGENRESLSHLGLIRYRVVTPEQTDKIPIANTRSAVPAGTAVARKNYISGIVSDLYRGGFKPHVLW